MTLFPRRRGTWTCGIEHSSASFLLLLLPFFFMWTCHFTALNRNSPLVLLVRSNRRTDAQASAVRRTYSSNVLIIKMPFLKIILLLADSQNSLHRFTGFCFCFDKTVPVGSYILVVLRTSMRDPSLRRSCRQFSAHSALGSGSGPGRHSAFGSSLIVASVLVLLLLDILDFGPGLVLVLVLVFICVLALLLFMVLACWGRQFLICFCFSGLDLVLVLTLIPAFVLSYSLWRLLIWFCFTGAVLVLVFILVVVLFLWFSVLFGMTLFIFILVLFPGPGFVSGSD